jgi:predicted RNA-binding protein with RPS1 domain
MNTTQNTNVLAFNKNAVIEGTVTGMAGFGFHVSVTKVDGQPFTGKARALLTNNGVSGRTDEDRAARIKAIKMGDTIEGLCTRAEYVPAKNANMKGKEIAQYAISERALISKRSRDERAEREAIEEQVLAIAIGSEMTVEITEVRAGLGAFGKVLDTVAEGRRALIHVSQVSDDRSKDARDAALSAIEVGTVLTAKVCKVERNDKKFIDIGLSLRDASAQQRAERQQAEAEQLDVELLERFPVGCEVTAKKIDERDGVIYGDVNGIVAVISVDGQMAENVKRAKSARVVITGAEGGRLLVEKQ